MRAEHEENESGKFMERGDDDVVEGNSEGRSEREREKAIEYSYYVINIYNSYKNTYILLFG